MKTKKSKLLFKHPLKYHSAAAVVLVFISAAGLNAEGSSQAASSGTTPVEFDTQSTAVQAKTVVPTKPSTKPAPTTTSAPASATASAASAAKPKPALAPAQASKQVPTVTSKILDLSYWKLTLPIAGTNGIASEIKQPTLAGFSIDPWFVATADKSGVVFRANHGGATTSGSKNPRSELREMQRGGTAQAAWSSNAGVHTMTITQRVTRLTSVKPHVVVGQIHGGSDDVTTFRLEGSKLWITDGDNTHAYLVNANYNLGTTFSVKFEVRDNIISYSYNGQKLGYTQTKTFSGAYFKAGNYLQSNPTTAPGESATAFSEVIISGLSVTH